MKELRCLKEVFKYYKGQPIEIITESGFKYCGIDMESDDDGVTLVDGKNRLVRIEYKHIEAVLEPQMKLERLCGGDDCDCCRKRD